MGKCQENLFDGLTKWMCQGHVEDALKMSRDPNVWDDSIANA